MYDQSLHVLDSGLLLNEIEFHVVTSYEIQHAEINIKYGSVFHAQRVKYDYIAAILPE